MLTGIKNTSEIFRRNNCGNSTESEEDKEKARKLVFEISPDKRRKPLRYTKYPGNETKVWNKMFIPHGVS